MIVKRNGLFVAMAVNGVLSFVVCSATNAQSRRGSADHAGHDHAGHDHAGHDHAEHDHAGHDHAGHDHAAPVPRQPAASDSGVIDAPLGGPPPLPTGGTNEQTREPPQALEPYRRMRTLPLRASPRSFPPSRYQSEHGSCSMGTRHRDDFPNAAHPYNCPFDHRNERLRPLYHDHSAAFTGRASHTRYEPQQQAFGCPQERHFEHSAYHGDGGYHARSGHPGYHVHSRYDTHSGYHAY